MPDLDTVRAALPALASFAYLNTGTEGPLPTPVALAMGEAIAEDEARGRISAKRFGKMDAQLAECRTLFARLVNTAPGNIALTGGTVDGVRVVLDGLRLGKGDRIVTTSIEHPAALAPVEKLVARYGVGLDVVDIATGATDTEILEAFRRVVGGARLVLVSHVSYLTGRQLPVSGIANLARESGAPVLVDGAQAVGAITVDFAACGADFYAFPGQKWLLGPEDAGALAVTDNGLALFGSEIAELERGTASKPVWAGMRAALDWRAGLGDETALVGLVGAKAARLRRDLEVIHGVEMLTPIGAAGLVSFRVAGMSEQEVVARLGAGRIGVRDVPGAVRVSCGFFNTVDELDALVEIVAGMARQPLEARA